MSSNVEALPGMVANSKTLLYRHPGEAPSVGSRLVEMPSPRGRNQLLPTDAPLRSTRIGIKAKGKIFFIYAEDVVAVEARGNYIVLLCGSSSHRLRESVSTLETILNAYGFLRIHRSVLVNKAFVEEIRPWPTGEYALKMRGGKEYTVTRKYKKHLPMLAQLWIGVNGFITGQ